MTDILTIADYVGKHAESPDWTPERQASAEILLDRVQSLADEMQGQGIYFPVNPYTGSRVSGKTFGGFRPQDCPEGAPSSAHKQGQAVDLYDPHGDIDAWIMANQSALERHGIYIEHPSATTGWAHWSTRAPASKRHVFYP